MIAKNIQDVVAEKIKKLKTHEDVTFVTSKMTVKMGDVAVEHLLFGAIEDTLTQLVKEVEAGEQDRILQELKDETNNWKETISHLTIEGIVTNWRDYENVYHDDPASDVIEK